MFNSKGQGTTEYLIILAVIIVIGLVVVGIMGWFPGAGTAITEQQSANYWKSTSPWTIQEVKISGTDATIVLQNMSTEKIEVSEISLNGENLSVTDVNVTAGQKKTITGTLTTSCGSAGNVYGYDVVITYDTANIQDNKQTGNKPLVGKCV